MYYSNPLKKRFERCYTNLTVVPYIKAIIEAPHIHFEHHLMEFISQHSLHIAPAEVIDTIINHKEIRHIFNFDSLLHNEQEFSHSYSRKNLQLLADRARNLPPVIDI